MGIARGGWNRRLPPEVARCHCGERRHLWAYLDQRAGQGCCLLPCCRAPRSAIVSTREEILFLRAQLLRKRATCPRCGQPIALHQRNFECVDALTRMAREWRARRGVVRC